MASVVQDHDQFERFLQIFLHDLRSPLGVAQGYMNLLRGQQLADRDRVRAIQGVSDALDRMATLVVDAGSLMSRDHADGPVGRVPAAMVCQRVMSQATRCGVLTEVDAAAVDVGVRVGHSVDALADAIALILELTPERSVAAVPELRLRIRVDGRILRFVVAQPEPETAGQFVEIDPWAHGKLDYLVAHRRLTSVGGGAWREVGKSRASCVTLPVDVLPI